MNSVLKGYSRYFNIKYNRKGPLWEGRFHNVVVQTDEQLLHLTRYIHLNPVTSYLIEKPENWKFSSYHEYINPESRLICNYKDYLCINNEEYKEFVESYIHDQRDSAKIKHLVFD
jgi:putative transposase